MTFHRLCLATAVAAVFSGALATSAHAEIRQGTATDRAGDSAGAPSQDIVSATAQYDSNGQITVTATMNGDIGSGPRSFFSFDVKSYAPPASCLGSYASMFGFSDSSYDTVMVQGVSGTGSSVIVRSGPSIAFGASGTALRDRDYSCMTLVVSDADANILDQLDVPLFFAGYGPDTDGDGVKDNQDTCPGSAGAPPSGCPSAPSQPTAPSQSTTPAQPTAPTAAPALTKTRAASAAKRALAKRFGSRYKKGTHKRLTCRKAGASSYNCRARWTYRRHTKRASVRVDRFPTSISARVR